MGQRGPAPTPTEMKRLAGNPGNRPLPESEPQPPPLETIEPPAWLEPKEAEVWRRRAPALAAMKVLTAADSAALELLCEIEVEIAEIRARIKRDGRVSKTGGAKYKAVKAHPLEQALRDRRAMRIELLAKFGMTPSDRTRLKVDPPKPKDPAEEFMGGADGRPN